MNRPWFLSLVLGLFLGALVSLSTSASARVRHDGAWPAQEKTVSLSLQKTPRTDAVRALAKAAGWSVVIHAPPGDPVDVTVNDESPDKVLDMLLSDRNYVAVRDGKILSIYLDDASAPPATSTSTSPVATAPAAAGSGTPVALTSPTPPTPPTPPAPPAHATSDSDDEAPSAAVPTPFGFHPDGDGATASTSGRAHPAKRGEDRTMTGGNLRIEKGETVHDVVAYGGNVDVYGTITGDASVTGGNLRVHDGGWVIGDASVIGGNLTIEGDASVDGDVSVMGGTLKRSEHCTIGGTVVSKGGDDAGSGHGHHAIRLNGILSGIGGAITRGAMLFVFGAVLLALASKRMETLRVEVVTRPMRSFAMGVVGVIGGLVLFIAFCVTIIGIPIALVGLFLAIIGGYAGVCAVLTVVGQALLKHKTESPYVHLAVGCALFIVIGAIPFIGDLVTLAIALVGIGVLVATRAAGMLPKRNGAPSSGPYRTVAEA